MNNKQAAGLKDVGLVPWRDITDSSRSAAAIPFLLTAIASGDPAATRTALDGLRNQICQYGFVVGQATAVTVPFLWYLAQRPHVTCRAQILDLLRHIADAREWETIAAAYPKLRHQSNYAEGDAELVHAVQELATTLGE